MGAAFIDRAACCLGDARGRERAKQRRERVEQQYEIDDDDFAARHLRDVHNRTERTSPYNLETPAVEVEHLGTGSQGVTGWMLACAGKKTTLRRK